MMFLSTGFALAILAGIVLDKLEGGPRDTFCGFCGEPVSRHLCSNFRVGQAQDAVCTCAVCTSHIRNGLAHKLGCWRVGVGWMHKLDYGLLWNLDENSDRCDPFSDESIANEYAENAPVDYDAFGGAEFR